MAADNFLIRSQKETFGEDDKIAGVEPILQPTAVSRRNQGRARLAFEELGERLDDSRRPHTGVQDAPFAAAGRDDLQLAARDGIGLRIQSTGDGLMLAARSGYKPNERRVREL
jgi:hypothetical protein